MTAKKKACCSLLYSFSLRGLLQNQGYFKVVFQVYLDFLLIKRIQFMKFILGPSIEGLRVFLNSPPSPKGEEDYWSSPAAHDSPYS